MASSRSVYRTDAAADFDQNIISLDDTMVYLLAATDGKMYLLTVDNSGNAVVTYVKLYYTNSDALDPEATEPDTKIAVMASSEATIHLPGGLAFDAAANEGLQVLVTSVKGLGTQTAPTSAVGLYLGVVETVP